MVTKNYKTYLIEKEKEYSQDESNLNIPYRNDRQYARAMQTQRDRERRAYEKPDDIETIEKLKGYLDNTEKYLKNLKAQNLFQYTDDVEKKIQKLKDKIKQKESEAKNG